MLDVPVQVIPFWTYSAESSLSRLIATLTKSAFSHTGVAFKLEDGKMVYFEALLDEGFSGPKDARKLSEFAKIPGNRLQTMVLPTNPVTAAAMYQKALSMDGQGYNKAQLVSIFLSERYGGPVPKSDTRQICSEAHARILYPIYDIRDIHHKTFDAVTPQSAWIRHLEIRAGLNPSAIDKNKSEVTR